MNAHRSVAPSVVVNGNVAGNIVSGDNNFVVNTNNGTIIRQESLSTQKRSLSPKPPHELEGFVGRKRELKQVEDWIAESKAIVICGMDGIGKTSLLKQAANSASAKSQPDGVVFVDALDEEGNLLEFDDLIQRIFDALFESQPHQKVDLTSARTYLSNTQPLVLLNAITLTPKNLDQLQNLFSKASILITTENSLLTRGRKYSISLGPLDRDDSLNLLAGLTNGEAQETLAQIATLLENVPAALSIVADTMRTDGLSAEDVLQRLQSYTPTEQNKGKAALERAFHLLSSLLTEDQHDMLDQVAAAFGVNLALPDRQVVALQGDGGFLFNQSETLWSIARYEAPMLIVIMNNRSYNESRARNMLNGGVLFDAGKDFNGYLGDPDVEYTKIAEAYGLKGEKVRNAGDLAPALQRCLRSMRDGKAVVLDINVAIDGAPIREGTWYQRHSIADIRRKRLNG